MLEHIRCRGRVWCWGGATAVALLLLEGVLAAAVLHQGRLVLAPGPAALDEVVGTVAAAVALLLGAWLTVSSTSAVLAHAPGRVGAVADRLAAAWAPLLTRRVAAVLVGATVSGGLAPATALAHERAPFPGFGATAPAAATDGASPPQRSTPTDAPASADTSLPPAGWTPSRPVQRRVPAPDLVTSRAAPTHPDEVRATEVVVHRGDTLWGLVSAHLGPDATDADIAAAWPRWHGVNRDVIGADPDRLLPGQVLQVPSPAVAP